MSRDTILTDDVDVRYSYDNLKTQGWLEGQPCGVEAAANYFREKAVELFKQGKDSEAMSLRNLTDEMVKKLVPEMENRSKKHETDHPIILEVE